MKDAGIEVAGDEIRSIMDNLDYEHNGMLNYTEFLLATMDRKKLLRKENLWAAFKHFDLVSFIQKNLGYITLENL